MGISFKKVDEKRKALGISVTDFTKKIGVSRKTYYDWEKDVVPILSKYLKPIEGILCIDVNDITEEDKGALPDAVIQGLSSESIGRIQKRVKWIIDYIIKGNSLSNVKLAKMLNISTSSIDNYRGGKSIPGPETLALLQNIFKVNTNWIMDGGGSAFLNTGEALKEEIEKSKYTGEPEVCVQVNYPHQQGHPMAVNENHPIYTPQSIPTSDAMFSSDQKLNIEEAMGKTYKVLSAGTALSVALYMNIQQFAAALDTGMALQSCQEQIKQMQEQIDALNAKVDRLSARPGISEGQEGDGSENQAM